MKRNGILFEGEVDLSNLKKTVYDIIFEKYYDGEETHIPFGDLPKDLQDTDKIIYISEAGHFYGDNQWEPNTRIIIERPRLETDEEQKERIEESKIFMEELRERRYNNYLKLKKEFESPII